MLGLITASQICQIGDSLLSITVALELKGGYVNFGCGIDHCNLQNSKTKIYVAFFSNTAALELGYLRSYLLSADLAAYVSEY